MPTTKKPYNPDMDACRMVIRASEATCYIMDTYSQTCSAEQRAKIDQDLIHIYRQALLRQKNEDG